MEKVVKNLNHGTVRHLCIIEEKIFIFYEDDEVLIYIPSQKDKIIQIPEQYAVIRNKETVRIFRKQGQELYSFHLPQLNKCEVSQIKLENGLYIITEGCKFSLFDRNGSLVFNGKHNDWVTDVCIIDGFLFTTGYDSCIRKWDLITGKDIGYCPLKTGWIVSITYFSSNNMLYVGTVKGEVFQVNLQDVCNPCLNRGAVWNIYSYYDYIYAVTEDGCVSFYDDSLKQIKKLQCSQGWVTGLITYREEMLIAITTWGELILIDKYLLNYKIIAKYDYWLNSIVLLNDDVFVATAEGIMLKTNILSLSTEGVQISQFQLIDLCITMNEIIAVDVEGGVYKITDELIVSCISYSSGIHFTSVCFDTVNKQLFIASTNGLIVIIDMIQSDKTLSVIEYDNQRIWKIDYSEKLNLIAFINSDFEITIIDPVMKTIVIKEKSSLFLTTCRIVEDNIVYGDNKGGLHLLDINNNKKGIGENIKLRFDPINHLEKYSITESSKGFNHFSLFYDSLCNSNLQYYRYKYLLQKYKIPLIEVDLRENDFYKNLISSYSSWPWFPQIFVNEKFLCAGSTFSHMIETGTFSRCLKNIIV